MPLLEARELTVTIDGTAVLDDIALGIGPGERVALIGAAGAGKSLLTLALAGLLPAGARQTGSIDFADKPLPVGAVEIAIVRGGRLGIVTEDAAETLDPLETIAEAMASAAGDASAALAALADVGLDAAQAARFPETLTARERQLAALGLALAHKPDLLIADQPTRGLDLIDARRVLDLIERHCRERGMALLLISHDLRAVAWLCQRIVVLKAGRVVESGACSDVFGRPRHDHTRQLIAAGRHRAKTLMRTPIGSVLLDVRGLTRRYRQPDVSPWEPRPPVVALEGIELSLRAGESVALVGPSGAGKSALARIVAGLDDASDGELEFDHALYHGTDLPAVHRADISMIVGDPMDAFDPRLRIGESVAQPLRLEPPGQIEELGRRIVAMVTAVGLSPEMLGQYTHALSRDQLQRFAIVRALIARPRLVVLDQPVAYLDIAGRGEVLVLLNRLRADYGLSFLIASHDLEAVRIIADRVVVMDKGRIVETGTPAQLLETPQHPTTRALVAASLPDVGIVPVF